MGDATSDEGPDTVRDSREPSADEPTSIITTTTATADDLRATRRPRPPTYEPGTRVGRYVVGDRIAVGGMGVVYRAHDPELDRDVALKVLRVEPGRARGKARARARLLREAQALAQLSHPNVIAAHDVGSTNGDVFVAMELVNGVTLKRWLRAKERSLGERLAVMMAAGRGLAAAHAAGLVHRDFKPANVLVGDDGRVRVADFGLARSADHAGDSGDANATNANPTTGDLVGGADRAPDSSTQEALPAQTGEELLSAPLTIAGTVLGTPGYMSPEQYGGVTLDQHTDQFSFCVTLYETVYGQRPFAGSTPAELRARVVAGELSPPPGARVPRWLRRLIERGLAVDRSDRFPSMDALLAELGRDRVRRRRAVASAAVALVVGAGVAFAVLGGGGESATCRGVGDGVREVFNDDVRVHLREVFVASDRVYAAKTAEQVSELLGDYADDWSEMRVAACRATRVRGDQSEQVLEQRMRCLDRRLGELRALVDELVSAPDAAVVDHAVRAVIALRPVRDCADPERLTAEYLPPDDPDAAAVIDQQYAALDRATALQGAGRYERALAIAEDVAATSSSIDYPPLQASAQFRLGRLLVRVGRRDEALQSFRDAALVAGRSHSDAIAAEAMIEIYYVTGPLQARYEEASAIAPLVDAVIARAGDRPEHRADALAIRGYVQMRTGEAAASIENLSEARDLFVQAYGPNHPHVAHALNYLSMAYNELGRFDESSAALQRSIAINERRFGPDHPMLIAPLSNLATLLRLRGAHEQALVALDRALAIARATLPADHPKVGIALATRATVLVDAGRCEDAMPDLHRSLEIFEDKLGPEHENVGYPLTGIGRCLVEADHANDALPFLERAQKLREKLPASDPERARTDFWLARAWWLLKRDRRRAVKLASDARAVLADAGPTYAALERDVKAWLDSR